MASDFFDFKEFRVFHKQSAMKVGTDSVLLGCLAAVLMHDEHILDIGAGSGILSLIIAQRSSAIIDAIEIDELAFQEASQNFQSSKWSNRLNAIHQSLQTFVIGSNKKYDCIVSNPPYFDTYANYSIANAQRKLARQDANLPFEDLAKAVQYLLSETGSFWLILPDLESKQFEEIAKVNFLFMHTNIAIYPNAESPVRRRIQAYSKSALAIKEDQLILLDEHKEKTIRYQQLTQAFYLDKLKSR